MSKIFTEELSVFRLLWKKQTNLNSNCLQCNYWECNKNQLKREWVPSKIEAKGMYPGHVNKAMATLITPIKFLGILDMSNFCNPNSKASCTNTASKMVRVTIISPGVVWRFIRGSLTSMRMATKLNSALSSRWKQHSPTITSIIKQCAWLKVIKLKKYTFSFKNLRSKKAWLVRLECN